MELFAPHIPHALIGNGLLLSPAPILELRRGQHSSLDVHHMLVNAEPELLNIRVVIEVGLIDEVIDLPFPVGR